MIYRLRDLIPNDNVGTRIATGQWVRAMHMPFYSGIIGRWQSAWEVFRGRAVAVRWPKDGEFEQAMARSERNGDGLAH